MANKTAKGLTFIFGADLGGFERAMKKAQKSLTKFGKSMKRTGANLSRNVTLPLVALGKPITGFFLIKLCGFLDITWDF